MPKELKSKIVEAHATVRLQEDKVAELMRVAATYFLEAEKAERELERLRSALNTRDLLANPAALLAAANEIDCGRNCERGWNGINTNASGCRKSEYGDYCANDVAETLRAIAAITQ
ncbi:hypothetical protein [Parvibaculum sp.]|uniref:hypothetical protein n=1 Tax=Parvibaculum sp. TaxID=2024848 RepID=UPI001D386C78|nr:hypothetical protein [Parvibaculum sp.]MBX3488567.1 hypothetical protein [Parvibaculum sp.]